MKYYRYLFLVVGLAYLGCFFLTEGLLYQEDTDVFVPVSQRDPGFLNDNFALLLVSLSALVTFALLTYRKFERDGLIMVTVLSFILQFGSFAWLEFGSVYATALAGTNFWLLTGLVIQALILLVITIRMVFD